jgi:hypothetical protein
MLKQYKLGKYYEKYTGMLNGMYPCKDGVVTLPDSENTKEPKTLIEHYGAIRVVAAKAEEPKK